MLRICSTLTCELEIGNPIEGLKSLMREVASDIVPYRLGTFLHHAAWMIVGSRTQPHVRLWDLADIAVGEPQVRI